MGVIITQPNSHCASIIQDLSLQKTSYYWRRANFGAINKYIYKYAIYLKTDNKILLFLAHVQVKLETLF